MSITNTPVDEDILPQEAIMSAALTEIFRGRLCQTLFAGKRPVSFDREAVLFELGGTERSLFFIQSGFVKVSTVTGSGLEVIFDVRKAADVVGELCVCSPVRRYRAVALEPTTAFS